MLVAHFPEMILLHRIARALFPTKLAAITSLSLCPFLAYDLWVRARGRMWWALCGFFWLMHLTVVHKKTSSRLTAHDTTYKNWKGTKQHTHSHTNSEKADKLCMVYAGSAINVCLLSKQL